MSKSTPAKRDLDKPPARIAKRAAAPVRAPVRREPETIDIEDYIKGKSG